MAELGETAASVAAVVDGRLVVDETASKLARRGLVLATMARLKQVCNHPAQLLHDGMRGPPGAGLVRARPRGHVHPSAAARVTTCSS